MAVREPAAAVADRRADPLLALLHRRVGQADHDHARLAVPDVDLDLDEHAVEPDDRATVDLGEQRTALLSRVSTGPARDHGAIGL